MPRALITGITGQDGSYLAELLLSKGYEVHGLVRRSSGFNTGRIDHLYRDPHESGVRLRLHHGDLTDTARLTDLVSSLEPDEVYNLAAQSHVAVSFREPVHSIGVDGVGVLNLLEALRITKSSARFYQAGTSEMFGGSPPPQSEATVFSPRSPYAAAKVLGYHLTRNYREGYGMFAVTGILFNHESERRGPTFVTRKITRGVADIVAGRSAHVYLGNLDAERDWGHASDYVEAMWMMLQQAEPRDFVIGTGESHSVREFCEMAFGLVGLDWQEHVREDQRYLRPTEVHSLRADPTRARVDLGWKPSIPFQELVERMVRHDLAEAGLNLDTARERSRELRRAR
jgi:GDPmannose 4,6-dehydratase